MSDIWHNLTTRFKRATCSHEFDNGDLDLTNILRPDEPARGAGQAAWDKWAEEVVLGNHPWHTHRVEWPCKKCGKIFYAHCGLDILAGRRTTTL